MEGEHRETPLEIVQGDHTEKERQGWIESSSIDELIELLRLLSHHSHLATKARAELQARISEARERPRLATMTPVYVMALAAMVLGAVAAWPVMRGWMHPGSDPDAAPLRAPATNAAPLRAP